MPKRDDDDLLGQDLPSMVPDKEDQLNRQSSKKNTAETTPPLLSDTEASAKGRRPSKTLAPKTADAKKRPALLKEKASNPWLSVLVVLLLCVGLAGLARWNFLLQENLYQQQEHQLQSQVRITELESRLSSTDESMNKSDVVMAVQLKELQDKTEKLWGQMDKLWASAWRRNQKEIAGHAKQLDSQTALLDQQQKLLKEVKGDLSGLKASLGMMEKKVATANDLMAKVNSMEKTLKDQQGHVRKASDAVNRTEAEQRKLIERVKTNEEWVQSINANRRQVNSSLDKINRTLNQLQGSNPASTP